jgi:hypothetical protein
MDRKQETFNRRDFFRGFFRETLAQAAEVVEEYHGRPQMNLTDLAEYPDALIRTIIPVFFENLQIQLNPTTLLVKSQEGEGFQELLVLQEGDFDILDLFGQNLSLEQIAAEIDSQDCDGSLNVYPRVKALFLQLIHFAVCHPAQSLVEARGDL